MTCEIWKIEGACNHPVKNRTNLLMVYMLKLLDSVESYADLQKFVGNILGS